MELKKGFDLNLVIHVNLWVVENIFQFFVEVDLSKTHFVEVGNVERLDGRGFRRFEFESQGHTLLSKVLSKRAKL